MSDIRRIMKISGNVTRGLAVDFTENSIYLKNKIILLDLTQLPLSLHNLNKVTLSWVK